MELLVLKQSRKNHFDIYHGTERALINSHDYKKYDKQHGIRRIFRRPIENVGDDEEIKPN